MEDTQIKQPTMIESAKAQADRLEVLNKQLDEKIQKLEELKAFETLGGKSEGAPQQTQPVEVSPQDYVKNLMSGKVALK